MLISDLQNRLRILVRERIAAGELTGTELANRAGFQQAHVSNFLNGRRGLSIESMDRVMEVMRLEVQDLMPDAHRKMTRRRRSGIRFGSGGGAVRAVAERFRVGRDCGILRFKKTFLRRMRAEMASERGNWQRFVLIKADKASGAAMRPRLGQGAMLLIDRHYNSLQSYRRHEPNVYVVKSGPNWQVRYVELQGSQLTLRPENQECGLGYIQLGKGETFANYVVGRVAHISTET